MQGLAPGEYQLFAWFSTIGAASCPDPQDRAVITAPAISC
jgi:hypothetical protein